MTNRRSGKSLIELIIIMSILSTVLALGGKTFALLMRGDARGRKSVVETSGTARLADRFRRDVHAAKSAEIVAVANENMKRLRLTLPDGLQVEYRPAADRVAVVVIDGKKARGLEQYVLGSGGIQFEIAKGPPEIVAIVHTALPPADKRTPAEALPRKAIRMEAVRGRALRYLRDEANSAKPKSTPGS